jgi:hypothetical protein
MCFKKSTQNLYYEDNASKNHWAFGKTESFLKDSDKK